MTGKAIASYASQVYTSVAGLAATPLLLRLLGQENYGLIGIFATLQAWFFIIDAGMFQMISREICRYRGGTINRNELWGTFRGVECITLIVAIAGWALVGALASTIANRWLVPGKLTAFEIESAILLMAPAIATRWLAGLYRQSLIGFEMQTQLAVLSFFSTTARFVMVIPILALVDAGVSTYFMWQLQVSLVELFAFSYVTYRAMPGAGWRAPPLFKFSTFQFSATVAIASLIWTGIAQVDKVILSGILPLSSFGDLSVISLLASGVFFLITPVNNLTIPLLTTLWAQGKREEFVRVYQEASQWVVVLAASVAVPLALCAPEVLHLYWGDQSAATRGGGVLTLYAYGYLFISAAAPCYYIQFAMGKLQKHLIGTAMLLIALTVAYLSLAPKFGAIGVAWSWMICNVVYCAVWPWVLHRRLLSKMHAVSLHISMALPIVACTVTVLCLVKVFPVDGLIDSSLKVIVSAICGTLVAVSVAPLVRRRILQYFVPRRLCASNA